MKDDDLKAILAGLTSCLLAVAEKQGLILSLLANELPNLSAEQRTGLKQSAIDGNKRVAEIQSAVEKLK